jgi:STE24 endopeptidase
MRVSVAWGLIAAVAVAAIAWGWSVGREAVPPRPGDQTATVGPAWYADMPLEPAAATAAYLARIPAAMRERGEVYSDTSLLAFVVRVLTLIAATAFICATGLAARLRDLACRLFSRRALIDAAVAVQYFAALYALSLPAEVYETFVRPHRFGFSDQAFSGWLQDNLLNWGVFTLFYLIAVVVIYGCIRRRPTQWVAWAIGVYLVLRSVYALLSPNIIEPLANNFRPLPEGPQKQQILALAHANGVDEVAVVTGDASRQTRLLNAHVS